MQHHPQSSIVVNQREMPRIRHASRLGRRFTFTNQTVFLFFCQRKNSKLKTKKKERGRFIRLMLSLDFLTPPPPLPSTRKEINKKETLKVWMKRGIKNTKPIDVCSVCTACTISSTKFEGPYMRDNMGYGVTMVTVIRTSDFVGMIHL